MKRRIYNPCSSVFLCGLILLSTTGLLGQATATVSASGGSGTPGSTVTLTVSFAGSGGATFDSLSFGLRICNVSQPTDKNCQVSSGGTAPPLAGSLIFTPDASLPAASLLTADASTVAVLWSLSPPISGNKTLGTVKVVIPSSAQAGQTYVIQITGGSVTSGGQTATFTKGADTLLNVTGTTGTPPVLALSSTSVSFSAALGSASPAPQTVTVSNAGGGTLSWTAAVAASPAATWLSVSPALGAGPGQLSISANIAGLGNGSYSGNITVTATGATGSPQTIAVTLTITQGAILTLSAKSLSFSAVQAGPNPAAQTVTVSNTGGGTLTWLAVPTSSGWLSVSPTAPSAPGTLTVSVTSAGLAAGTYNGTISVTASSASGSPQTINVTLTVSPSPTPVLALSTTSLTFTALQGGVNPSSQTVAVSNAGGGTMSWTASASSSPAWLSVTPLRGTNSDTLTVSANIAGLNAGTYRGSISVTAPGAGNSPQQIAVTLTVTPPATLVLNTQSMTFSGAVGDSILAQPLAISNTGAGSLNWTSFVTVTGNSANWLSVTPSSGTTPLTASVKVDSAGLTAGTYQGSITVSAAGALGSPQTVNVTLTLAPPTRPVLSLNPPVVQFAVPLGASPATLAFQVQNIGINSFNWTAGAPSQPWLAVQPTSGSAGTTVAVTATPGNLAAGNYSGTIAIQATDSNVGSSPQNVTVTLAVGGPIVGPNAVVNAASFSTDVTLSPGSLASLFGVNLAPSIAFAGSLPLPTTLASTQVLVNGVAAPLLYVSPGQINFQIPYEALGSNATVVVVSNNIRGISNTLKLGSQVPGIFTRSADGKGPGAVLNADSSANSATNPAPAGSVVQIYSTGLGATNPPAVSGQPGASQQPLNLTVVTPVVLIGNVPAQVQFSGLAPGFVGLYQVNAVIPSATPPNSSVPVQIQVNGQNSNVATIAVK